MSDSVRTAGGTAPIEPAELGDGAAVPAGAPLEQLLDVALPVAIEFGRTSMTVQEILDLGPGSVVQLDRMVGEPIDIYVGDRRLAEGEVVVVGEHFGVRITRVLGNSRDNLSRLPGA
ncbi:MAG: flagellar motor switch protein FliN [Gemmatimonadales bacterium]|nr:flagellar motor switch protein FliN [Gemmatimonadales bacterium]